MKRRGVVCVGRVLAGVQGAPVFEFEFESEFEFDMEFDTATRTGFMEVKRKTT